MIQAHDVMNEIYWIIYLLDHGCFVMKVSTVINSFYSMDSISIHIFPPHTPLFSPRHRRVHLQDLCMLRWSCMLCLEVLGPVFHPGCPVVRMDATNKDINIIIITGYLKSHCDKDDFTFVFTRKIVINIHTYYLWRLYPEQNFVTSVRVWVWVV